MRNLFFIYAAVVILITGIFTYSKSNNSFYNSNNGGYRGSGGFGGSSSGGYSGSSGHK
jgi:hypothetical protein